jgi:hypothetical protein
VYPLFGGAVMFLRFSGEGRVMKVGVFSGMQCLSADRRSCGSGFFVGVLGAFGYVCSNAHVWGTKLGDACFIRGVSDDGSVVEVRGVLKFAGYKSGTSVDWAIAEVPLSAYMSLPGASESQRLVDLVPTLPIGYVGGPRCELPSFRRVRFVRVGGGIAYGAPAAIGGMSGGAWQHDGKPCAITTWTDGTHNMAQTAQALKVTMRPEFFASAEVPGDGDSDCPCEKERRAASFGGYAPEFFALPAGAVPACEVPQYCVDGYHAQVSDMTAADLLDECLHPGEIRAVVGDASFDWAELIRLLLPLLLEFLRNRNK